MGKIVKMSFERIKLQIMGKWTEDNYVILKKKLTPGVGLPSHGGNIHVYYNNIQRSSSLKPLGQSKPNFMGSIYGKGESMCL